MTEQHKRRIIDKIFAMQDGQTEWLKDYLPEEQEYIRQLIINQTQDKGFTIDMNTAETKFRKHLNFF